MDRRLLLKTLLTSPAAAARKKRAVSDGFANPLVGGGGGLVYPSIHSPNYVPGSSGWSIKKDGSAEFDNVTIRGGSIVDGIGLQYNGSPALGNLVASTASSSGTDSFGNFYFQGTASYLLSGGTYYAAVLIGGGLSIWTAAAAGGPYTEQSSLGWDIVQSDLLINSALHVTGDTKLESTAEVLGALTAIGGTAASPTLITTDTSHGLGALGVANLTISTANYVLCPDGRVFISIIGIATGAVAGGTATFPNALAAAYRPATEKLLPAEYGGTITAGEQRPRLQVNTNGQVTLAFPTLANGNLVSAGGYMDLQ